MHSSVDLLKYQAIIADLGNRKWFEMVRPYQQAKDYKAWIQLTSTLVIYLFSWFMTWLLFQVHWGFGLPCAVFTGFVMSRLFIIQHDCGHESFFSKNALNHVVGWTISFFTFIPYTYWRRVHKFHHNHNGELETHHIGDIATKSAQEYAEMTPRSKFYYRFRRNPFIMFFFVGYIYVMLYLRFPVEKPQELQKYNATVWIANISLFAFWSLIVVLLGWQILWIHLLITWAFSVMAFWFFYVQHQHEEAFKLRQADVKALGKDVFLLKAIVGSSFYDLPAFLHWMSGNIGFHHIHHLSDRIPNYRLKECYLEQPLLSKHVSRLTFSSSFSTMKNKVWSRHDWMMKKWSDLKSDFMEKIEKFS